MTDKQVRVTFAPSGRAVFVLAGAKMLEAAGRAGLTFETPCGGAGTCGRCRVQVTGGACDPTPAEREMFSADELAGGWRLACQTPICGPTAASIPPGSLFGSGPRIVTETTGAEAEVLPGVRKIYVELDAPTLADSEGDLTRLEREVGAFKVDLAMVRRVTRRLRKNGFKGTAVLSDHRLIDFEQGDTSEQCYGAAFDIGTTTLVGVLLDLRSGEEPAIASRMNPQVSFGDDVLSRIEHASKSPENLEELRLSIVTAVAEMIDELCGQAAVSREHVYEVAFSGNTPMSHLLCGIDVAPLGVVPFTEAYGRGLLLTAAELGIPIHHSGRAYVFPLIGGFVGGDAVAGMLATGLTDSEAPALMVDIGTNGEIVLAKGGKVWAASTAAGPAFEGARISCGMRATRGAIEKVVFDADLELSVIGDVEPVGICGSGLVDLAAGLLDAGIVTPEGRLLPPDELPDAVPAALRARVRVDDGARTEFVLAEVGERAVTVTQRDVRELQLAAGAIRAGIRILLRSAGLAPGDLERVLIAGGFGSFIRRSHAQRIGLLPGEVDHRRIHYVGNTSLCGAKWALLSTRARKRAEHLARLTEHVQLSEDADFQREFVEAMIFPAGD